MIQPLPGDARLCAAVVSFRDWFAQTPARYTSGRIPARRMALIDYPQFVANELGLPAAELWSIYFDDLSPDYCRKLGDAAARAGVSIRNILLDRTDANLGASDIAAREHAVAAVRDWIDRAAAAGAASVRINPVRPAHGVFDPATIADSYLRLAEHGATQGIGVLIENHRPHFDDVGHLLDLHARVARPNFALLADSGNIIAPDDSSRIAALTRMLPVTALVAIKGVALTAQDTEGEYDMAALVRAAEASGYRGVYSIELFSYVMEMPLDPVSEVLLVADTIRSALRPA